MNISDTLFLRNILACFMGITLFYWSGKFCGEMIYLIQQGEPFALSAFLFLTFFATATFVAMKVGVYLTRFSRRNAG